MVNDIDIKFILCIFYGIFNEEVSISGSRSRVINKLKRTWKEPIVA
jgi:hypothetical protein